MIAGFNFIGKGLAGNVFTNNVSIGDIHYHELKNCKVDYEKIDEDIFDYNTIKKDWDYDTVLLTDFSNMEISNVSDKNTPIQYLKVKKRQKDTYKWEEVYIFDFDKQIKKYNFNDKLIESLSDYEYALQPIGINGIVGNEKIQEVSTDFEGLWIVNNNLEQHQFNLGINDNMQMGNLNRVTKSNIIEPIGNKYPIVISNENTNYRKTSVTCALIDKNYTGQDVESRKAQKKYRQKIEDFLSDGKPKIIKHGEGLYILGVIPKESISITPFNDLDGMIAEVEFEIVEVGDATNTFKLQELGFVPETNRNRIDDENNNIGGNFIIEKITQAKTTGISSARIRKLTFDLPITLLKISDVTTNTGKLYYSVSDNILTVDLTNGDIVDNVYNPNLHSKEVEEILSNTTNSFPSYRDYDVNGYVGSLNKSGDSYVSSGASNPYMTTTMKVEDKENYEKEENIPRTLLYNGSATYEGKSYGGFVGTLSRNKILTRKGIGTSTIEDYYYSDDINNLKDLSNVSDFALNYVKKKLIFILEAKGYIKPNITSFKVTGEIEEGDFENGFLARRPITVTFTHEKDFFYGVYEGMVSKPASDTRVYSQKYTGTVYKGGDIPQYKYDVTLEYFIRREAQVGDSL